MQPHAFEASLVPPRRRCNPTITTRVEQYPCLCARFTLFPLPIEDAMLSCIAGAVNVSFAQHNRTNGATVSLMHGNMVGKKLFSVSIYPSRSITLRERPTWEELFEFAKANLDLLLRPGHALGTWFDEYDLVHCLDVVVLVRDRDDAMELGFRFDQIAIFDLEARRETPILPPCRESSVRLAEAANE